MKTVSKHGERLSLIYRNNMQQIYKISLILKVMHGRTNRIVTKLPACSDVSFIKVLFSRLREPGNEVAKKVIPFPSFSFSFSLFFFSISY